MSRERKKVGRASPRAGTKNTRAAARQEPRPTNELREDTIPYRANGAATDRKLRFIDLFCGIGGIRIAFEKTDCESVFSSDWNEMAQRPAL